ncbi:MAG TPA: xanthine dehydrogenase family protein subunit M [Gaiellaceae bacterium]|nr:xanthine dehydrogenase family protein subunit M [Gaiellaceae bacterium]
MKPVAFAYRAPETLEETLALLEQHGDEATVLAGGQSLVPLLNLRIARPRVVVDVNRVAGLGGFEAGGGALRLGALVRTAAVERDPGVAAGWPGLREAIRHSGHPQIRNRSTVGGSVAHADPASELPAVLVALEATVTLRSTAGARELAAADFFVGPFTTARRPDELVTEVRVGARPGASAFREVARRHGDFALVGVYAGVDLDDGSVGAARIALCGASPVPLRAVDAEHALAGRPLDERAIDDAAEAAAAAVDPWDDLNGPAEYRRDLARVLTRRTLSALAV